jgi:erythromycin esterase
MRTRRPLATWGERPTRLLRAALASAAQPLRARADLDPLLERIGAARYVLLGEASHGTQEYYAWRDLLSRRLIDEKGFSFIAVEGDWPDCYRVNRYVKGYADAGDSAREVLHNFVRWPTWMWANHEIVELAEWLRSYNDRLPQAKKVGFYGVDVYSLWDSLYQVMGHLRRHHPGELDAARQVFQCFQPYAEDVQEYARAALWGDESCAEEAAALLAALRRGDDRRPLHLDDRDARFNAELNALVVRNAERYYRTMVRGDAQSWNIRDRHMADVLERLMHHHGPGAKGIVWAHNTHIGDARFTDMSDDGMVNLGQLAREQHGDDDVVLVGFGSYEGSVIAGRAWEAAWQIMEVPAARAESWEAILRGAGAEDRLLIWGRKSGPELHEPRGHRAIGVVYRPDYERGNYVPTVLPRRYDALIYLDRTEALRPLHEVQARPEAEAPETFPTGV